MGAWISSAWVIRVKREVRVWGRVGRGNLGASAGPEAEMVVINAVASSKDFSILYLLVCIRLCFCT